MYIYCLCVYFTCIFFYVELSTLYRHKLVFERKSASGISKMSILHLSNIFDSQKRFWMIYYTPELDNYVIIYSCPYISHMKRDQLNKFIISVQTVNPLIL